MELGCLPLRFIIKARRINYLHYLVNLKDDELLAKFFNAQCNSPSKGDWINTVKDDLTELGMNTEIEKLKSITKESFKEEVKKNTIKAAFQYLINISKRHSKMDYLKYDQLSMQKYLK